MTELADHAIEGPPTRAAAGEAGLSVPAGWPYEDPRFPPPAPAVHNGAWIDGATGTIHAWWTSAAWPSSWSNSCRIDAGATPWWRRTWQGLIRLRSLWARCTC